MAEVAVIGAGVVGCAVALELARRGAEVVMIEAEPEPGLQASGTNSGIVHTGFDSPPGELETTLILRAGALRSAVFSALGVPLRRCGALMSPADDAELVAVTALARNAERNGVEVTVEPDGSLLIPGESITDPVAFTLALAAAARDHGVELRAGFKVERIDEVAAGLAISSSDVDPRSAHEPVRCRVAVNCAGLGAGRIARAAGDDSFEIYPRKGEFLVFEPPREERLEQILLPVPGPGTKGVLVFPTLDGKIVAGPTAVDQEDPDDRSVRPEARAEIVAKGARLYPPLADAEPIVAYAGLRPAGRGVNYVIATSTLCSRLVNVAAIRSTGLTASLAIAEHVAAIVARLGVALGEPAPLATAAPAPAMPAQPWWRRAAAQRVSKSAAK